MKLRVLALDYDGTIARNGAVHPQVLEAIREARVAGVSVVLVTGRILADLRARLPELALFDAIVAENGAVSAFPSLGRSFVHASRCAREILDPLRARGLEALAGECLVELEAAGAKIALEEIRRLGLPLVLLFNRERLMILPQAVSKATGLREALRILRLSPHNAIGVGDAENDHELLAACEIGAAVAWGSESLRQAADLVVEGDDPGAVAAWVRELLARGRIVVPPRARRRLVLGRDADGNLLQLAVRGRNVLIAGAACSGKSWLAGLLCEQLVLQDYCLFVIDPEGDYESLESLPGVLALGGDEPPPSMQELARVLRHPETSVVLDLARLSPAEKRRYVLRALRNATALRRESGLPHRIVLDEAHYFLRGSAEADLLDEELAGHTLVSFRVSELHPKVLRACECVLVTREDDLAEVRRLHEGLGAHEPLEAWSEVLSSLDVDEAALLPGSSEAPRDLRRFRLAPRMTLHVRHRHKYLDVPVAGERAFRFVHDDGRRGPAVASLQELIDVLARPVPGGIEGHLRRGDFSRWVRGVFRDETLAERISALEERHARGLLADPRRALIQAIEERYRVTGHFS